MPFILPFRTYWPTIASLIYVACNFIQRHQKTLKAVANEVAPDQSAAIDAAFTAIISACDLFLGIMALIDPNWKPK